MRLLTITIALAVAPLAAAQSLEVSGSCPGEVTFDAAGLSPGATVAWLYGLEKGDDLISRGSCAGAASDLGGIRLGRMAEATFGGNSSVTLSLPDHACDTPIQVLDTETCAFTNVTSGSPPPAPLYASTARGCGTTDVYTIDVDAGTYEFAWNNGNKYTALAGFDGRMFAGRSGFDGTMDEVDPATGDVLEAYYTGYIRPGFSATPDGTIYSNWGGSTYTFDGNAISYGGTYIGAMHSSNTDIAADDDGNVYFVDDGNWGTIDFMTGSYTDLGGTYGWESGPWGSRDRVSAFEYHDGRFFVVNADWNGAYTELFELNVSTGEATYIMELPACIDGLGSLN